MKRLAYLIPVMATLAQPMYADENIVKANVLTCSDSTASHTATFTCYFSNDEGEWCGTTDYYIPGSFSTSFRIDYKQKDKDLAFLTLRRSHGKQVSLEIGPLPESNGCKTIEKVLYFTQDEQPEDHNGN